ncbi:hypothetical protein [Desertivirga arenae]|uniref:hypothetical protein n=1 Tax=Desertivirga arenae TaxID=2810309 RepID=UPI001A9775BC|nr:hypothetical protein [Pedobacter sp. SYSU D00823]
MYKRIDWNARKNSVKDQFGSQIEKILYSGRFDKSVLHAIEKVYFRQELLEQSIVFKERDPLNFPGPFYTSFTDNCGTGQQEAPDNIVYDHDGREHIFVQPRNLDEMLGVISAAYVDPFSSYGFDGNDHWNLNLIREWWRQKDVLISLLSSTAFNETNNSLQNLKYIEYLTVGAKHDLMKYAFFLEKNYYPGEDERQLPEIE